MKLGSISYRIIILLITTTVFCLGSYFTYNYLSLKKSYFELLDADRAVFLEFAQSSLAIPVFNLDSVQIDRLLKSLLMSQNIEAIAVRDNNPAQLLIAAFERGGDGSIRKVTELTKPQDQFFDTRPITHYSREIGIVEIYYTDRYIQQRLNSTFWSKATALLLLTFALSFIIFLALRKTVIRPLSSLENFALSIGKDETLAKPDNGDDYATELKNVQEAMSDMQHQLQHRFDQLTQSQEALRESQTQLQQAQKMEAIGRLAGGIAHDFNNILQGILGYTEILLLNEGSGSSRKEHLERIQQGGQRARDLVRQILAFSRQSQMEKIAFDLRTILSEVVELLRASIPATVVISQEIEGDCGMIEADPSQFHQVVMNLCTNAYHAMEDNNGTITIRMHPVELLPADVSLEDLDDTGDTSFIRLEIIDSGKGISEENLERIFDPFFTTKEAGQGTGMGLSVVYGHIEEMGGAIRVSSIVGEGTKFTIYLPTTKKDDEALIISSDSPLPGGTEKLLIIDDEEAIVSTMAIMLEQLGYTVDCFTDSSEALAAFQQSPEYYDLVITDFAMPGLSGLDLADRMLSLRKDIAILLCTGFSAKIDDKIAKARGIKGFAYKPIDHDYLARLLRALL